jgi:hypothetical protein
VLPLAQRAETEHVRLQMTNLFVIERSGLVFTIASDKGNGVPFVEKLQRTLHFIQR